MFHVFSKDKNKVLTATMNHNNHTAVSSENDNLKAKSSLQKGEENRILRKQRIEWEWEKDR